MHVADSFPRTTIDELSHLVITNMISCMSMSRDIKEIIPNIPGTGFDLMKLHLFRFRAQRLFTADMKHISHHLRHCGLSRVSSADQNDVTFIAIDKSMAIAFSIDIFNIRPNLLEICWLLCHIPTTHTLVRLSPENTEKSYLPNIIILRSYQKRSLSSVGRREWSRKIFRGSWATVMQKSTNFLPNYEKETRGIICITFIRAGIGTLSSWGEQKRANQLSQASSEIPCMLSRNLSNTPNRGKFTSTPQLLILKIEVAPISRSLMFPVSSIWDLTTRKSGAIRALLPVCRNSCVRTSPTFTCSLSSSTRIQDSTKEIWKRCSMSKNGTHTSVNIWHWWWLTAKNCSLLIRNDWWKSSSVTLLWFNINWKSISNWACYSWGAFDTNQWTEQTKNRRASSTTMSCRCEQTLLKRVSSMRSCWISIKEEHQMVVSVPFLDNAFLRE